MQSDKLTPLLASCRRFWTAMIKVGPEMENGKNSITSGQVWLSQLTTAKDPHVELEL